MQLIGRHSSPSAVASMQSLFKSNRCTCGSSRTVSSSRSIARTADVMQPNRSRSGRLHVNAVATGIERTVKTVSSENLTEDELKKLLQRPRIDFTSILGTVSTQLLLQQLLLLYSCQEP